MTEWFRMPGPALVATSYGPVQMASSFSTLRAERPLVLVIRGALAPAEQMSLLHEHVPECDVVWVDLPGMAGSPHFPKPSIQAFADAIDEAAARFPHRRKVILGVSAGALVGFFMRQGDAILALDPPLLTPASPSLIAGLQRQWRSFDKATRSWLIAILGVGQTSTVKRDYRPALVGCDKPGVVLIAGRYPNEPPSRDLPGLLTEGDRALVADHPLLRAVIIEGGGHNLLRDAARQIVEFTRQLVLAA